MATPLSTISDAAVRDWTSPETATDTLLETDPANLRVAVNLLLDYLAENEKSFSASSAPTDTTNGFLWHDSTNNVLKLRRGEAYEQVLTENTVGTASIAAGSGTARGRPIMPIFKNTTQVSLTGATGALIAATIPASTLNATGASLRMAAWGTKTGASSAASLQVWWGGASIATHTLSAGCTDWFVNVHIVYTGASAQDTVSFIVHNRDDTGSTDLCNVTSAAVDTTGAAVVFKVEVSALGALDALAQEAAIIEFLPGTV